MNFLGAHHAIDKLSLSHLGHAISDPILWIEMGNESEPNTPYRINASDRGMAEVGVRISTLPDRVYPSGFFHTASPLRIGAALAHYYNCVPKRSMTSRKSR